MDKEYFYKLSYYEVIRLEKEQRIISLLSKNASILKLSEPSIDSLKERLLSYTLNKSFVKNEKIENEDLLNLKISEILSQNELFQKINDSKVSNNLYTSAYRGIESKVFLKDGTNLNSHETQGIISNWVEDILAARIVNEGEEYSYQTLFNLLSSTELLYQFRHGLKKYLPKSWLQKYANQCIYSDEEGVEIENKIETFNRDYFSNYSTYLDNIQDKSEYNFVIEAVRHSDYATLNDKLSFKASCLLQKDISLWFLFWDHLKYPILQEMVFYLNSDPNMFLSFAKELNEFQNKTESKKTHLAFIILRNLFKCNLKVSQNLIFYGDENSKDEHLVKQNNEILREGIELNKSWIKDKINLYKEVINSFRQLLTFEMLDSWIFSYRPQNNGFSSNRNLYNEEIKHLQLAYGKTFRRTKGNLIKQLEGNINLQKFNFLHSNYGEKVLKGELAERLLNSIITYIGSNEFHWDQTFYTQYWDAMKGIGKVLSLVSDPLERSKAIIVDIKFQHEGWLHLKRELSDVYKEVFVYCGLGLLLENEAAFQDNNQRIKYFNSILVLIISQYRFSRWQNEVYEHPLHILCLIANQILQEVKKNFETKIIDGLDDVASILRVLNTKDYKLEAQSRKKLKSRLNTEYAKIKSNLIRTKRSEMHDLLEKIIQNLDLV